ncbi:FYVE, RhoGEF and PH domain-containing protein 5-like isoform X1 [Erpetoichthys calabaricus]|uniref:FYVE, RhoGEF and PH domain-containing protein 5-like isoform X1 n=1 Tax=Erpetoichthys calabaricus TaxID=27687 RepID=UPI0022343FE2|nr:FYVE, RhoGEF and PH domain-containing protein 5-like isoform X1 [Erpetoichthys calabaricus]
MSADCKKPPLAPKPKSLSQRSSKVPSSLMSKSSSNVRGPRPPIPPKPKLQETLEEKDSIYKNNNLNRCINGKLLCSTQEIDEEFNNCSDLDDFPISEDGYIMYPDDEGLNDEGDEFGNDDSQLYVQSPGENGDDGEEKEEDEECETRDLDHFDSADERQSFQPSELRLSALTEEPESEDETDSVQPNYTSDCEHLEAEISEDAIPDTDVDGEEGDDCSVCEDDPAFSSSNFNGAEGEECDAKGFPEDVCENPNLVNEEHYSSGDPLYDSLEVGTEFINMDEDQTLEEVDTRDPLSVLFAHEQQQQDEEEEEIEGEEGEGSLINVRQNCPIIPTDAISYSEEENQSNEVTEEGATELLGEKVSLCSLSEVEQNVLFSQICVTQPEGTTIESGDEDKVSTQELSLEIEKDGISLTSGRYVELQNAEDTDLLPSTPPLMGSDTVLETLKDCEYYGITHSETCHQEDDDELQTVLPEVMQTINVDEYSQEKAVTDDDMDFEGLIVPYNEGTELEKAEDTISEEHVYEEAGPDMDGDNLSYFPTDRKSIVTRTRSLSAKMPGYVPETVPEECGPESDPNHTNEYCTVSLDKYGQPFSEGECFDVSRGSTPKSRRFMLYPRSYSVEGRDMPMSVYRENDGSLAEDFRIKRKEDNLSLPCFIGSSGSFSQRSNHPSSGMSTPSSVVDIPPPFELAYITKKPINKSTPSLSTEGDSPDKQKKKKSSFKRFLTFTFKKKTENKVHVDVNVSSSRSSSESSHHGPVRILDMDRRSIGSSPKPVSRSGKTRASDSPSTFLFYKDSKRKGTPKTFSRSVARVESFEDRSRPPFMPLPLTKPRSISFPNADTSDYENIPAINSDYENIQIPPRRPTRTGTFTEFFEDPSRALSSANENDGYVDMSSFTTFESKPQTPDQETESAYTEAYKGNPVPGMAERSKVSDEDNEKSSAEEDGITDHIQDRQADGQSRAFYIAKELLDSEKVYMDSLKLLHVDFREVMLEANRRQSEPLIEDELLTTVLRDLPMVYSLHREVLGELEERISNWEEQQGIAGILVSRRAQFSIFTRYIAEFDRNMALLDECCQKSSTLSKMIQQFEQRPSGATINLKHHLLKVVIRILQYSMLLTDYLNNLSPDSKEYEDTQAALAIVSEVADRANDCMKHGENLRRLVHIEYSVRGQKELLRPGRVFVKEGTLMKVSGTNRHPRHLFLMNDVLLYTYPQQDGKYRLKNTLSLSGMKISKPFLERYQNALRIDTVGRCLTLSAGSGSEREDWYHTLCRAVADYTGGQHIISGSEARQPFSLDISITSGFFGLWTFWLSFKGRDKLWMGLGEKPPALVPVSHVMMCMNCTSDFTLTIRRHHCHACGKIVCRSCSRNKYPLKYLKDRLAKVCDQCFTELKKRGADTTKPVDNLRPRSSRSAGRPLSAVFLSIHPQLLWKPRKSSSPLAQVSALAEGSSMSGPLNRCKKSKRHWKKLWFVLKDKVLYTYMASEDKVATESLPLLGFTVKLFQKEESPEPALVFQLYHKKTLYYTFRAEDTFTARRWIDAMEEATVL